MRKLVLTMALVAPVVFSQRINPGGVLNASGYQNKLAPNVVFVIFGSGLGPATLTSSPSSNYPMSLAGTSITFTPAGSGTAIPARIVYTVAAQVAGLLPSSLTPGTYAVRVTYNGTASPPENVTIAARSFGIATVNSAGSGPAQATIGNVNGGISLVRFTSGTTAFNGLNWTLTPAHPGDTLVFWGTGGGADPANDDGGTSGDQTAAGGFMVNVGGRDIKPAYAGTSFGYPGLWQVNFTLPPDIAPDCYAPARITASGEASNTVTLAIAAAGQAACADANLPPALLSKLDNGGTINGGAFGLVRTENTASGTSTTQEFASGAFYRWTAAQWATGAGLRPARGECRVYDRVIVNGRDAANPGSSLDAGLRLPLTGPNLPATAGLGRSAVSPVGPIYILNPLSAAIVGGATYALSGLGGADVGSFGPASSRMPDSFVVTNINTMTSLDRTKALTFNWTGAGFDHVLIDVNSLVSAGQGSTRSVTISCDAPAAPGAFTIPATLMQSLLPTSNGGFGIYAQPNPALFTATLAGGDQLDFGSFGAERGYSKNMPVQ